MKIFPIHRPNPKTVAFTLIELLVVVTILAVLAGLLMPAVTHAMNSGKLAGCNSNARQIAIAFIAFDNDNGHLPWNPEGHSEAQYDATGGISGSKAFNTNWNDKLVLFKYLSSEYKKGVWRCPAVSWDEMAAKDVNGNAANWGGYGICWNFFRAENNYNGKTGANTGNRPVKMSRIPRPTSTWLIGDCGQPVYNTPGEGRYYRTASSFGRPSQKGSWDFSLPNPKTASQPALRHEMVACFAAFDAHVSRLDWLGMQAETNDFTARIDGNAF